MVIVDEARRVGLGLGKEKEKWEPDEAFSVDTLTCAGSRFLVVEEDLRFGKGGIFGEGVWESAQQAVHGRETLRMEGVGLQ